MGIVSINIILLWRSWYFLISERIQTQHICVLLQFWETVCNMDFLHIVRLTRRRLCISLLLILFHESSPFRIDSLLFNYDIEKVMKECFCIASYLCPWCNWLGNKRWPVWEVVERTTRSLERWEKFTNSLDKKVEWANSGCRLGKSNCWRKIIVSLTVHYISVSQLQCAYKSPGLSC